MPNVYTDITLPLNNCISEIECVVEDKPLIKVFNKLQAKVSRVTYRATMPLREEVRSGRLS